MPRAVKYWKAYYGQLKGEGSQFAAELVKDYTAKKASQESRHLRLRLLVLGN